MFFPSARLAALLPLLASLTVAAVLPSAFAPRQAPNTLYQGDPASQTASLNFTSFVFGIKRHDAEKLAGGHKILPAQGLPQGYIKDDEVPVVFLAGLFHDIRQLTLKIPNLNHGQLFLPFVDASDDGSTPFTRLATIYQSQPVPVLAGTLQQGVTLIVANFDPRDAAYKAIGGNQYSIGIDVGINNDGLLGLPLPDGPVFSAHWHKVGKPVVDPDFFKGVMQAPYQHTYYNTCSQSKYVFNETFASPFSLVGDVQTLPPTTPSNGDFKNVAGFSQTVEWNNPPGPGQPCASFRAQAQAVRY
ncbi:unnamed protein product [Jaminaea pallidilutea]